MRRLLNELKYWYRKVCLEYLAMCPKCLSGLNYDSHGRGICPHCIR